MRRRRGSHRSGIQRRLLKRLRLEPLELRQMMCADGDEPNEFSALGYFPAVDPQQTSLAIDAASADALAVAAASGAVAALNPLNAIPVLNSLPGAAAALYLDFDGHTESSWGGYSNVVTPVFDQDGDATTFSAPAFDAILVDAPCSGSGTWRRTPDAKRKAKRYPSHLPLHVAPPRRQSASYSARPGQASAAARTLQGNVSVNVSPSSANAAVAIVRP